MATVKASRTEANLRLAFATETLLSRRCLAYAARAEAGGNTGAAALFRRLADRRNGHAQRHLEKLEPCGEETVGQSTGDTAYNLRAAILDEVHECRDLYPGMARNAREEGLEEIAGWFETLAKAGRSHASRLRRALETLM
jgi:rubrerythrin